MNRTNEILTGDCLAILPTLDPDDFAVLVTDPPYGVQYNSNQAGRLPRSVLNDETTAARDAVLAWWHPRPALVFGSWKVPRPAAAHTLLVWDTGGALGMGNLSVPWKPAHQEIYVLGYGFTGRRTSDVIRCPPVQARALAGRTHPTEKPVSLLLQLLEKCPPGAVLDPFAGTGSTLRAADDLGRPYLGIELVADYATVARQRLAQGVLPLTAESPDQ